MHELSITQSMLDVVLEHAQRAGAKDVVRIDLRIGQMSGIVDESIQFYFDFISRDTLAEGARLVIHHVPARFSCLSCSTEFEPGERDWVCPNCGATGGRIVAGQEMAVESIEVD
jgi:hydrogenase nickel incorporation protein HypA/HybF